MKLLVPVGIPGCGKSTWGNTMFGQGHYRIVCSDDIRRQIWGSLIKAHECTPEEKKERNEKIWKIFYRDVEEALKHGMDVYADATNLTILAREKLRDIAEKTSSELHLIVFDNVLQGLDRNQIREKDKQVPQEVMENFLRSYAMVLESLQAHEESWYASVTRIENLGPNEA